MESNNNKKLTKQQTKIINDLYSSDENKILGSIKLLREEGGDYSIIPLMDIFFTTGFAEVQKSIGYLISDLKNNSFSDIITENLYQYTEHENISLFLSELWQSSLKFNNLDVFIEIFLKGDDKTALECFTIVEQNIYILNDENKNKVIELLKKNIESLDCFKRDLANDILKFT